MFSPSSLWKIKPRSIKEAIRGLQDRDQDPQLMDRGVRVLAPTVALASSQGRLPTWFGNTSLHVWPHWRGHGYPGNAGEPTGLGRQELPSLLGPRASATLAPQELGWLSSPRLLRVGQEGSWGQTLEMTTALFTSSGPGRWHTLSRMAQAWGPVAWGSG